MKAQRIPNLVYLYTKTHDTKNPCLPPRGKPPIIQNTMLLNP